MTDTGTSNASSNIDTPMPTVEQPQALSVIDDWKQLMDRTLPPIDEKILDEQVFHWDITNYDHLPDRVQGPTFVAGGFKWNILLFPRGNSSRDVVSIYLEFGEIRENPDEDVYACAQFVIYVSRPSDPTYYVSHFSHHRFTVHETDWGFTRFLDQRQLHQHDATTNTRPLLENKRLRITACVRIVKDPTGVLWHSFVHYDSKKVTGFVGLKNQGATCYMNSLFQSLYCTNYFRKAVYQIPTENDDPNNSIPLSLQRLFYNLQFSDHPVGTTEVTRSFGWTSTDAFMQHDVQEFNRVLQDNLEEKMKGTPADGAIKKLFLGRMKSYIKCINVEYESSRSEDYYDIQLNVKGLKNIEESFKNYIAEEILEGENKYMAENYGLQDAKKGVIFESFPPVLHLQLKRFEYDFMHDTMVKINDRYEFPLEIDLEPYLSDTADKRQPHKYILHGVLVHSGDLNGHYFAFVKPTKQDRWLKFDDDRVTPAALKEVLEENFGGEPLRNVDVHGKPTTRPFKRYTNAYMLVYIRETMLDDILADVNISDIPHHLIQRSEEERLARERRQREREEQHLFMNVVVATCETFQANQEFDFTNFDGPIPPQDLKLHSLRVPKSQPYGTFVHALAEKFNLPLGSFRVWFFVNRQNHTVRVDSPIPKGDENLTLEEIRQKYTAASHTLRLYIDVAMSDTGPMFAELPFKPETSLVFIKLFEPELQRIRGLGTLYVHQEGKVGSIVEMLNAMAGFPPDTPLLLYEEIKPDMIDPMDKAATFTQAEIQNGDIICMQRQLSDTEEAELAAQGLYTTVPTFMDYQRNKIYMLFVPKNRNIDGEIETALLKDTTYGEFAAKLASCLGADPGKIQFYLPDQHDEPKIPVSHVTTQTLESILNRLPSPAFQAKLYYDVLDIPLVELDSNQLVKITLCIPNLRASQLPTELWMPKQSLISDLLNTLSAQGAKLLSESKTRPIRVFEAINHQFHRELQLYDPVSELSQHPLAQLYAEQIPLEEQEIGPDDFFFAVFHFQREVSRKHSVPFKFLVKKDEPFSETKKRLQARTGLSDNEWTNVKFNIVSPTETLAIDQDDFKLSDYAFNPEDSLGLEHVDRTSRTNRSGAEKPLSIRG